MATVGALIMRRSKNFAIQRNNDQSAYRWYCMSVQLFPETEVLQKRTPYLGCFILEGLAFRTADDLYDLSICLVPVPPGLVQERD